MTKRTQHEETSGQGGAFTDAYWEAQAAQVTRDTNPLKVPYDVGIHEALAAARFVKKYWRAEGELPGLSRLEERIPETTSERIISLVHQVEKAQTALLTIVDPVVVTHGAEARETIDELESALEYLLDDGVDEPADHQLAAIEDFASQNGHRSTVLIQTLRDLGHLAGELKDRLVKADKGFDVGLIARAGTVADQLEREAPATVGPSPQSTAATRQRNRYLWLLDAEVAKVRSGAQRVFRKYPAIVREVTSAYQRRLRAARRRAVVAGAAAASAAVAAASSPT
jgi:hypothetical protein